MSETIFPDEAVRHLARCNCNCKQNAIDVQNNYHLPSCMVGKAQKELKNMSKTQRLVRHFDEYPLPIRPRLRDIRKRKGRVLAICEYECRQCRLKMDDTQSDVNESYTRACCPRCRSEDLRDGDYEVKP